MASSDRGFSVSGMAWAVQDMSVRMAIRRSHENGLEIMKKKKMSKKPKNGWLNEPEEHDYPAAMSYLSLIYDEKTASDYVDKLKRTSVVEFKAKDIFRASGLPLLGTGNSHVKRNQEKSVAGKKLSPLLLVRDKSNGRVIITDGYHRMCAIYSLDEDAVIPCKIV